MTLPDEEPRHDYPEPLRSPPPAPPPPGGWPLEGPVMPATATFDLSECADGITVGPDEVLVIRVGRMLSPRELAAVRAELENALGRDRYIILMADGSQQWGLAKVAGPHGGPYQLEWDKAGYATLTMADQEPRRG